MLQLFFKLALLLILPFVSTRPLVEDQNDSLNANHIFNAIHSSMRQFGSSLHHNGMSFFIATVPAGTHFYHSGSNDETAVKGMEWLAFEPEHALIFARNPGPRHRPRPPPPLLEVQSTERQHVLAKIEAHEDSTKKERPGYFHTYTAKHDLRLLYVDGQAAAKSNFGTLDTQDYILAKNVHRDDGTMGEWMRAHNMCKRAREQWKGHIDGILRMEGGFEIILCSFEESLDLLRISPVLVGNQDENWRADEQVNYFQSIGARYQGIGGNRVKLDYEDFVSAFTFPEANLFQFGKLPRLNATDSKTLDQIRAQVDRLASKTRNQKASLHDWQSVVDMIVARYSPRLAYISSLAINSTSLLQANLDRYMRPFIDYKNRDSEAEIRRCTQELIPGNWPINTAGQAVWTVSRRICSTMSFLSYHASEIELDAAVQQVNELMEWLDWTTWKQCTGCKVDEVCVVPMWPWGGLGDWKKPNCANRETITSHMGYWNRPDFSASSLKHSDT